VEQTLDEILEHHGIKGMKWGTRRVNSSSSEDATRTNDSLQRAKTGGTKALTTKDLQDLVTRLNLEKQYAQLKPPSKGTAAVKFVADILVQVGKQQATKLAADQTAKLIAKLLTR
jgi:hypothetical protein